MTAGPTRNGKWPLHVLTITPFYPNSWNSSEGCFVAEPLAELIKQGVQSTVVAVRAGHHARPLATPSAPPAQWLRYPTAPGNPGLASAGAGLYLRLRGPVLELHRKTPIDLIHAHAALPCGEAARRLCRKLEIPYVVSVHGLDAFSNVQVPGWLGRWCSRVSREVYETAACTIAVSHHVGDEVRMGAKSEIAVVHNGTDASLFQPGDEPQSPVLLSVGNLLAAKGHSLVVKALAELRGEFPGLTWEVIGEGPELDSLRRQAESLGVLPAIHFRGRQPRAAVAEACRNCTIFVLPSRYEGLGCVYLEAMASGKVAIGCSGQGIEEIIHHDENGWLVRPDSQTEITEGLRVLLRDSARRQRIGQAARETVAGSLTLRHQAARLLEIYKECVG